MHLYISFVATIVQLQSLESGINSTLTGFRPSTFYRPNLGSAGETRGTITMEIYAAALGHFLGVQLTTAPPILEQGQPHCQMDVLMVWTLQNLKDGAEEVVCLMCLHT